MTKEEYLKKLILQRWTLKDFAAKINMPYGTLYSILKNVDGGSMYNIVKICSGLPLSTTSHKAPIISLEISTKYQKNTIFLFYFFKIYSLKKKM